jgi:hypothetical protein
MSGWTNKPSGQQTVTILTDYVDPDLTKFLITLVPLYTQGVNVIQEKCGYACSDQFVAFFLVNVARRSDEVASSRF